MRKTIRIDDELHVRAKALAARTGRSLTEVIEDALRQMFERGDDGGRSGRFSMPTACGDGVQPGVDLDDSASLWDLTEDDAAPGR